MKRGISQQTLFLSTKNMRRFHDMVIYLQYTNKEVSATHVLLKNKDLRLVNQQMIKTYLDKCTSNNRGEWHTMCTQDMRYGLIPPHRNNIVNHSIPGKPRLHARFGWTMIKYAFMSPPTKREIEGKVINIQTLVHTGRRIG